MAWVDDRLWCHEKFTDVTPSAAWTWVKSITYASGMGTRGRLTVGQQKLVGATSKTRRELIKAGLWDVNGDGKTITIHDWHEHNQKRDERKARDRERKRLQRQTSAGQSKGTSAGQSTARPRVETVEGSETPEEEQTPTPTVPKDVDDLITKLAQERDLENAIAPKSRAGQGT